MKLVAEWRGRTSTGELCLQVSALEVGMAQLNRFAPLLERGGMDQQDSARRDVHKVSGSLLRSTEAGGKGTIIAPNRPRNLPRQKELRAQRLG
eukprot:3488623-Pyramimonas_sp.AAC.1